MDRKKKQKTERREPYVTDEQIRTVLDRGWAKLRADKEAAETAEAGAKHDPAPKS